MNIIKILPVIVALFFGVKANAQTDFYEIVQKDLGEKGFYEPVYKQKLHYDIFDDQFNIELYAETDDFPFSSLTQGSVFYKIFSDLMEKEHIALWILCAKKDYNDLVSNFEHGKNDIAGLFGQHFENIPYSVNKYFYPSFAENKIHLVTVKGKTLDITQKSDLKNYKGIYTKEDKLSSFVIKDFKKLGLKEADTFEEMYEELLTGRVDFAVASYYKGQIKLYQQGIRNHVNLSRTPVWTVPLFFRLKPEFMNHPRMVYLKKYIQSSEYKQKRDEVLEDMLATYRENTKGIVPPTYMNSFQSMINTNQNK
ncbi:MAG: hypothetical protein IKW39_04935 [Alphaproteobacteria bacterium]|nr:hypothetical protein [Alphaproteobacteria bacterium]